MGSDERGYVEGYIRGVQELESFVILDVPDKVIPRVARVISAVEKSGIPCLLDRSCYR